MPAPAQIPAPAAIKRALDVLKSAKRPLIILGKGAAYAQADDEIRTFVEKSGVPFLPMSMAKGLLPDTHPQCAGAARSMVLKDSDVVMLIGARLNWLLSHGKGKAWGEPHSKKFIQIDIEPKEMDCNVEIVAPVVGDIGSCVAALHRGMGAKWTPAPADWLSAVVAKREENVAKMAPRLMNNASPMDYHGALGALRTIIKERPDAILVNEGANTLDLARGVIDMYQPRKRLDVGTWGVMGIGMGFAVGAAIETGKPVLAVEGDSAFGFSGMEVETICRYNLPVCVVVFNNDGIYRGTDVNPAGGADVATTVFVKGARYDKMIEAFGGVGVNATTPDELKRAVNAGDGFRQADPDQRRDRPGRRQRERPHRQSQSAKRAEEEVIGRTCNGHAQSKSQGESQIEAPSKPAAKKAAKKAVKKAAPRSPSKVGGEEAAVKPAAKKPAAKKPAPQNGVAGLPPPSTKPSAQAGKALDGVRILDFTHVQSGPTCTQLLGYMGADCIKVERPGVGDVTRGQLRDVKGADSLYFTMLNGNKRSITIDSKHPKGKEILDRLIKHCDVLVENFAPGALDRMGLTWEHIHKTQSAHDRGLGEGLRPRPL